MERYVARRSGDRDDWVWEPAGASPERAAAPVTRAPTWKPPSDPLSERVLETSAGAVRTLATAFAAGWAALAAVLLALAAGAGRIVLASVRGASSVTSAAYQAFSSGAGAAARRASAGAGGLGRAAYTGSGTAGRSVSAAGSGSARAVSAAAERLSAAAGDIAAAAGAGLSRLARALISVVLLVAEGYGYLWRGLLSVGQRAAAGLGRSSAAGAHGTWDTARSAGATAAAVAGGVARGTLDVFRGAKDFLLMLARGAVAAVRGVTRAGSSTVGAAGSTLDRAAKRGAGSVRAAGAGSAGLTTRSAQEGARAAGAVGAAARRAMSLLLAALRDGVDTLRRLLTWLLGLPAGAARWFASVLPGTGDVTAMARGAGGAVRRSVGGVLGGGAGAVTRGVRTGADSAGQAAADVWQVISRPVLMVLGISAAAAVFLGVGFAVMSILRDGGSSGDVVFGPTFSPSPTAAEASQTPAPGQTTAAAVNPTPNVPQGAVSLGLWANGLNAWWFGDVGKEAASYKDGGTAPFLVRISGTVPETVLTLDLRYDCAAGGVETISYLSGLQDYGSEPILAAYGPGRDRPDAAIPVPDTPGLTADDGTAGVLFLYGGTFTRLPGAPQPEGACQGTRTASFEVRATGDTIFLLGSVHLAAPADSVAGTGASAAPVGFGMEITAAGQAPVRVNVLPGAVSP